MWDINIFEHFGVRNENRLLPIFIGVGGGITILILLALVTFSNYEKIQRLKYEINISIKFIESEGAQKSLKELLESNREKQFQQDYVNTLKDIDKYIKSNDIIEDKLIQMIFSSLPTGVNFTSIGINGEDIQMQCISKDMLVAGDLLFNLKKLDIIESAYSSGLTEKEDGTYNFSVVCKIKDVKQYEEVK